MSLGLSGCGFEEPGSAGSAEGRDVEGAEAEGSGSVCCVTVGVAFEVVVLDSEGGKHDSNL